MKVIITGHAKSRMITRKVTLAQIEEALNKGQTQSNKNGRFVRHFVAGETAYPLHVGFVAKMHGAEVAITVQTVIWKGKPDY